MLGQGKRYGRTVGRTDVRTDIHKEKTYVCLPQGRYINTMMLFVAYLFVCVFYHWQFFIWFSCFIQSVIIKVDFRHSCVTTNKLKSANVFFFQLMYLQKLVYLLCVGYKIPSGVPDVVRFIFLTNVGSASYEKEIVWSKNLFHRDQTDTFL